jgi:aryl-alcohol dehydrogenase-like predicted oxidoreductase
MLGCRSAVQALIYLITHKKGETMQKTRLGHSNIDVSRICLGTMTWGDRNTQSEAFEQMDYALRHDVTFWDTAELYAVPPQAETYGATETIIGQYFKQNPQVRDKIVLASKIVGRTPHARPEGYPPHHHGLTWVREGHAQHDRKNINEALDNSLRRLQTDYLDLYQLHWPDRPAQRFGVRDFFVLDDPMAPTGNYDALFLDVLETMRDLIKAGKIRAWGLSNETAWGVMKYIQLAEKHGLPKPTSVQNPYSLLDRRDEMALSEICLREDIAYLPYSPLGAGALTGKYMNNQWPEKARFTLAGQKGRYYNAKCNEAIAHYAGIAKAHGLNMAQMALAFCLQRPFVTAPIIGATDMTQLATNISSHDVVLSQEVLDAIHQVHEQNPNPGP